MSNTLKTAVLLAALGTLFIAVGGALGGVTGMLFALVIAVVVNVGAYWFSGDIALRMTGAHEVDQEDAPALHQLIDELASYARIPSPRVAIVESCMPNAFATGRDARHAVVAVTTGVLPLLSRDELAGVLAHELGHIRNKDILISSIAATLAGALIEFANVTRWSIVSRSNNGEHSGIGGTLSRLLMMLLGPMAATVIQLAVARSREYGADQTGARIHGNPDSLARALEKLDLATSAASLRVNPAVAHLYIVNPLRDISSGRLFTTHPPVAERVRRLRLMQPGLLTA
jgi:heat shock protein HtpX